MNERPNEDEPLLSGMYTGELDDSEVARLLERAERDPELSSELDLVADVMAAAELEREALEADLPPEPTRLRAAPAARRGLRTVAATLLAAAAGLALTFWLARPPTSVAALGVAVPPPFFASELRDGADLLPARFAAAMEAYVAADWFAAGPALDAFLGEYPEHGPGHFYRGVVRTELHRFDEAAADFAFVSRVATGYLAEHARWRSALLALQRDDPDSARAELERLRDEGAAFAPNAVQLLARLGDR